MTLESLHQKLQSLNVSTDKYYLHGLYGSTDDNDKIALTIKRGKFVIEYFVYYRERGKKHSERIFTNEAEACKHVLSQIQEELTIEKAQQVVGLSGMTVNERLWTTGLADEFDRVKKKDKLRAAQILRILKVDNPSIKKILN